MNQNWSIKLLVGDGGVTGYNEWELVFKPSTQETYKLTQRGGIAGQAPLILPHASDTNAPIPARAVEANKRGTWELTVYDDDNATAEWDTILNNVHTLNRHWSGASSTATRHSINGTAEQVRIAILPAGATNTTYWRVQWGHADVSRSYYNPESQQGSASVAAIGAWFIPINLTFEDGGEGDTMTLRNDLPSSPHMIEDSNSDGLADGWISVNLPTSTTINTSNYLVGGQSQQVVGDQLEGIESAAVTATTPSIAGYAWIRPYGGSVQFRIKDTTGNVVTKILTDGDTNSVADKTAISLTGTIWYRVSYSGALAGNDPQIQILSDEVGGAFLVDAAYLQLGTLVVPDGWCSSSSLKNRYDPLVTTAATRQQINYLDVWGIPGDLPALSKVNIDPTSGKATKYILGAFTDGIDLAQDVAHWHESDDFTDTLATWTTGTGTIGNHYFQQATTGGMIEYASIDNKYSHQQWRVYVLAYTSDTDATIKIQYYNGSSLVAGVLITETETGQLTQTSKWQFVDLGILNLVDVLSPDISFTLNEELTITQTAAQTIRIDGVLYLPTSSGMNIAKHYDLLSATGQAIDYDPKNGTVFDDDEGIALEAIGTIPDLIPGNVSNRYIFVQEDGTDDEVDITTETDITLTVTPRTSHLLGTQ